MSSDGLANLSDHIGDLTPNTPIETALALAAAIRAATDAEELARFRSMLGLGEDQ